MAAVLLRNVKMVELRKQLAVILQRPVSRQPFPLYLVLTDGSFHTFLVSMHNDDLTAFQLGLRDTREAVRKNFDNFSD